ncbi:MAG: helix-turn-helix transcriptional regulator [Gammaproteobacteria bacterium]
MAHYQLSGRVTARLRELGKLIAAARRARGFTQAELAERAGTSRPTVNRIESGRPNIAWGTIMTVCWLLDIPTDPDLLDPARRAELLAAGADVQRVRTIRELDDDF